MSKIFKNPLAKGVIAGVFIGVILIGIGSPVNADIRNPFGGGTITSLTVTDLNVTNTFTLTGKVDANFGINTSSPGALLEIVSDGTADFFNLSDGLGTAGDLLTITTDNLWGINDTGPDAILEIVSSSGNNIFALSATAGGDGDVFMVTNAGLFGINDTTPDAILEIVSSGNNDLFALSATAGGNGDVLLVNKAGVVAIGGVTPVTGTRLLLPSENDAATPTLAFGDGDTGFFEPTPNSIAFSSNGAESFRFSPGSFNSLNSNGGGIANETTSATNPVLFPRRTDTDTGLGSNSPNQVSIIAGGHEMMRLTMNTALADFVGVLIDSPDQVSLTSASGSLYSLIKNNAINVDWDGGTGITALNGQTIFLNPITNTADQATTITTASSLFVNGAPIDGSNITITDSAAIRVANTTSGSGTLTNQYGIYIESLTAGTNNYGLILAGGSNSIGIGDTSPDALLEIVSSGGNNLFALSATAGGDGDVIKVDNFGVTTFGFATNTKQGADLASATNLVIPVDGDSFELTGTTQVDLISNVSSGGVAWQEGKRVKLICNENVTIADAVATSGNNITMALAGDANFSCTAQDNIVLELQSTTAAGQFWGEETRSAN